MGSEKITYAGVIGAAAGFVGVMGLASGWFTDGIQVVEGTADVSGKLAFAMAIATFVFGGAYILLSDPGIRRAMGALVALCAVVLTLACLWGQQRADQLFTNGGTDQGLFLSALGGVLGICAGLLALQTSIEADEAREVKVEVDVAATAH
jgi:drug/metabolite transporter (DMT)-like permease